MLVEIIDRWARSRPGVTVVTPADPARRAGIISLRPSDVRGAAARLARARVSFSVREGAIRLSPHFYNTAQEIERALEALEG
jgi:selenocysteine lyase/cysteine desulfurase